MAIAGVLLSSTPEQLDALASHLGGQADISHVQRAADDKLVLVLERPSEQMTARMEALRSMEGVYTLDLAYMTYEDDIEERGHIVCPPHQPRKHGGR